MNDFFPPFSSTRPVRTVTRVSCESLKMDSFERTSDIVTDVERVGPFVSLCPTLFSSRPASIRPSRFHKARFRVEDRSIRLRAVEVEGSIFGVTCSLSDERYGVVVVAGGKERRKVSSRTTRRTRRELEDERVGQCTRASFSMLQTKKEREVRQSGERKGREARISRQIELNAPRLLQRNPSLCTASVLP